MRCFKLSLVFFLGCFLTPVFGPTVVGADNIPHPRTYILPLVEVEKHKAFYDDPRPMLATLGPKQVLPEELYRRLSYDIEKMKSLWTEVVGFSAPDVVNRIAPEVKPGTYSHEELNKYPGFKDLMSPSLYNRIKPGQPPFAGNIPEFEVIPTRQYYWALPIALATKQNEGKAELDQDGYLIPETWISGYPFPQPSGKFKAQQIMYNIEKRYSDWSMSNYVTSRMRGFTKGLEMDTDGSLYAYGIRFAGRVVMEPYGWFDKRAKTRGELKALIIYYTGPRDMEGAVQTALYYLDPKKTDQIMMHLPSIRRIRKMSGTDTQDQMAKSDQAYDDLQGFSQKLSPTRYPYKYKVIEEREYLVRAPTLDGSEYISSKGIEFRNVKMERRPIYVVELTQLDPNYIYGRRILYIDKETFSFYHIGNYDQKGRLYRTFNMNWSFFPEMGQTSWCGALNLTADHLESHSSAANAFDLPAFWGRGDFGLKGVGKGAK
jgi:hypothetical protein